MVMRSQSLIADEASALADRMKAYFDADVELAGLPDSLAGLKREWARFDPKLTRQTLLRDGVFDPALVQPFLVRPFDAKWAYFET